MMAASGPARKDRQLIVNTQSTMRAWNNAEADKNVCHLLMVKMKMTMADKKNPVFQEQHGQVIY